MVCGDKNLDGESGFCDVQTPFDRKIAGSDGVECSVAKDDEKDLRHLVENSCISCNRFLENREIKVMPPRYIQEKDRYVRSGAVNKRLMCVQCYNALKSVMHNSIRYKDTPIARKNFFMRTVINNILLKD